jgi:hypothetical protein
MRIKSVLQKTFLPVLILLVLVTFTIAVIVAIRQSGLLGLPGSDAQKFGRVLSCFSNGSTDRQCLDTFVAEYAGTSTTRELLADLELSRTQDTTIENQCHPIAHAIGRYTYQKFGNVGDAFLACDQSCHSGCYHGVMERLFYTPEQIAAGVKHLTFADMEKKVPGICDDENFSDPSQAVIFQCLHGVGHAILFSLDYDLEAALESCDLLATDYERQSCYGGVVMENITAFEKEKRDLNLSDPHYPCNKLNDKYKITCYMMQTSVMVEAGLTHEQIVAECRKAGPYISYCFISLGRDISNSVRTGQTDMVINVCENLSIGYETSCINGAVYALIDNTWDTSFAYPFCTQFKSETNQRTCFTSSSNYVKQIYSKTEEELTAACMQYASGKSDVCTATL